MMAGPTPGKQFKADDPLRDLWESSIDLQDKFCESMNTKYSPERTGLKNWRHLAERFKVKSQDYEAFSGPDDISPSENMLDHLETVDPDLTVGKIKEACENASLMDVRERLCKGIEEGKIQDTDKIGDLWNDKAQPFTDDFLLMLDRNKLWIDVAKALKISKNDYENFQSELDSNLARDLFDILTTEKPNLTVQDLKVKLDKIKHGKLKKMLDEKELLVGSTRLTDIRPDLSDMEQELNKKDYVYKLARLFKKDRCLLGHDLEKFRPYDPGCRPTYKLIEYVIQRHPEGSEPTIRDLISHLIEIKRKQELELFEIYLQEGELEKMKAEVEMRELELGMRPNDARSTRLVAMEGEDECKNPVEETREG